MPCLHCLKHINSFFPTNLSHYNSIRPQYKKVKANLRRCLSDRHQMRRFFPDGSMASR